MYRKLARPCVKATAQGLAGLKRVADGFPPNPTVQLWGDEDLRVSARESAEGVDGGAEDATEHCSPR